MSRNLPGTIDEWSTFVTGRSSELFLPAMVSCHKVLQESISNSRCLVIGGAGSIGAATLHQLISFRPKALHIIDQNENNLAELVRDIRSSYATLPVEDFQTLPLDFGSPLMHLFLRDAHPYQFVLNFAALKHVRSERSIYSILQMLDTNILKASNLLHHLTYKKYPSRYFSVSTDKAANPVNLMGASKRVMEHLIFSGELTPHSDVRVTSARFANVAFSDGSLLDSFLKRLQKNQPLAVPKNTRRYFVSLREAGQNCLLAAVVPPHQNLLIPSLQPENDLCDLESVAVKILQRFGFEPQFYGEEKEAKMNLSSDLKKGCYPVLLTELDTSGEKPYEEFVASGETTADLGLTRLLGIKYLPAPAGAVIEFIKKLESLIFNPRLNVTKQKIVQLISTLVPEFNHIETGKSLDERM